MGWSGFVLIVNVTGKLCAHGRRDGKARKCAWVFLLDHDIVAVVLVVVGCAMLQSQLTVKRFPTRVLITFRVRLLFAFSVTYFRVYLHNIS